jgi:nicotinamidase-related amidase
MNTLSREVPVEPGHTALLIIDVQNYCIGTSGSEYFDRSLRDVVLPESAARDACDLGYLVTVVADACTTSSAERHEQSLIGIRGYCRQRTTDQLLAEIGAPARPVD